MDVEITVRNYRCFGNEPVSLRLRDGFTALVGMNNSGKSSLLRLPYEMRGFFEQPGNAWSSMNPSQQSNPWWPSNLLPGERQLRAGAEEFELSITVHDSEKGSFLANGMLATARFTFNRAGAIRGQVFIGSSVVPAQHVISMSNIDPLVSAFGELARTMYVGPFRNAISVASGQPYYDLQIGTGFIEQFANFKSGPNSAENEAVVVLIDEIRRIFDYNLLISTPPQTTHPCR